MYCLDNLNTDLNHHITNRKLTVYPKAIPQLLDSASEKKNYLTFILACMCGVCVHMCLIFFCKHMCIEKGKHYVNIWRRSEVDIGSLPSLFSIFISQDRVSHCTWMCRFLALLLFSLLQRSLVFASQASASQTDAVTVSFYMDFEDPNFGPGSCEASGLCAEPFSPRSEAEV